MTKDDLQNPSFKIGYAKGSIRTALIYLEFMEQTDNVKLTVKALADAMEVLEGTAQCSQ